jgi:hypothetical protein
MRIPSRSLAAALAATLSACAAVGVVESSDPWDKYKQGCALLSVGRIFPAERLLGESLAHYESSGERLELAMVQMQYALVLESPTFVVSPLFSEKRDKLGGREALPARARELNQRARDNLAAELTVPQGISPERRTQLNLVLAEAQLVLGEQAQACAALAAASESYRDARDPGYPYAKYSFKTVPEYVAARRTKWHCN